MLSKKILKLKFISAEAIRDYRHEQGLTQTEFWNRIGVTQSGGSRYESGRAIPRPVQMLLQLTYGSKQDADVLLNRMRDDAGRISGNEVSSVVMTWGQDEGRGRTLAFSGA